MLYLHAYFYNSSKPLDKKKGEISYSSAMENEVVVKSLTNNYPETDPVVIHHTPGCLAKGLVQNTQHNTTQHTDTNTPIPQ